MKVLVFGSTGQLGTEIIKTLGKGRSDLGKLPEIYNNCIVEGVSSQIIDITQSMDVINHIIKSKPDVIINCAAYTNVDACEDNKDAAFKVNALGAKNIASASEKIGAKLVHVSTDYVFDKNRNKPYCEYDLPAPKSVYGNTKYLGEQFVREFCSRYFIVRTSWLYGYIGNNFVKTIMRVGREKDFIKVVNDQIGNPTNAVDLVYHIFKISASEEYGVFHCTGLGECSWFDFASRIIDYSGIKAEVIPCTTVEFPRPAKRPLYSSLDNLMLRCTVGDEMRSWDVALNDFIDQYDES